MDVGCTLRAQETLTARAHYGGQPVTSAIHPIRFGSGGIHVRGSSRIPPDLPSMMLASRIVFIGMPLVPSVSELVVSELLWLNYSDRRKPVTLYIHSLGSQTPSGETIGLETEATAILDTMAYIRPQVWTIALGQSCGSATMLLASGTKGHRFALEHARIMTCPPRLNRTFGPTTEIMAEANGLDEDTEVAVNFLSRATGKDRDTMRRDLGRNRYFSPREAIEYGLIDHVLPSVGRIQREKRREARKRYEASLAAWEAKVEAAKKAEAARNRQEHEGDRDAGEVDDAPPSSQPQT